MRLDKYLIENGFFPSREKAQTAIKHNTVKVNGNIVTKASMEITENMQVEVIDLFNKYVSMGGLKLEKPSRILNWISREKPYWTSVPPPAGSPTAPFNTGPHM